MKSTRDDFKDKLAGRQDKVAAVKEIKESLAQAGLILKVSRRKLASGTKIYFTVSPPETVSGGSDWLNRVAGVRDFTKSVIREHFPDASLTSGGPSTWTIAEY